MESKSICDYMSKPFAHLFIKLKELTALNECVQQLLPLPLKKHCRVTNHHDTCLVITAPHAALTTELRLHVPTLLVQFKQVARLKHIQQIHITVQTVQKHQGFAAKHPQASVFSKERLRISKETAAIIHKTAQTLSDTRLKEIMEKIARHGDGHGIENK